MSLISTTIRFVKSGDPVIYLSSSLLKSLNLSAKDTVKLYLGAAGTTVKIKRVNRKGMHLYVSSVVRKQLMIPRSAKCFVTKSGNQLRIGPLIGIMCTANTRSEGSPFGSKSLTMRRYLIAGAGKSYFFAFTPRDINWQQGTINAYFWSSAKGWLRRTVPLPDVVYNRITNRTVERAETTEALKTRLSERGIPIFNYSFFDKWEVYHMLKDDKEANAYVPESYINPSQDQIKTMLEKHKFVYLKPTSGYMGIGIYRLTYHPKRGYFLRYRKNGKNVLLRFPKFQSLVKQLNRQSGPRLRNYVVQQGIRLVELDQCPLDFRFHLNKNKHNKWVVAGIGGKKAGRGSVTTHVRSGGQLLTPSHALASIFGEKEGQRLLEKAKKATILLAEAIERNYKRPIGELGFDIGIDKKGNIWMFEANSKPGRSIFKHPALREQGRLSYNLIVEHCLYLSKFRSGGDD